MEFIAFVLGIILGLIVGLLFVVKNFGDKWSVIANERIEKFKESIGKTQFIEPIVPKEEFKKSEKIDEFINKING